MCYVSRIICGGKEWSILLRIYCEVTLDLLTLRFQFPGASRKKYRLQELGSNFCPLSWTMSSGHIWIILQNMVKIVLNIVLEKTDLDCSEQWALALYGVYCKI